MKVKRSLPATLILSRLRRTVKITYVPDNSKAERQPLFFQNFGSLWRCMV